MDKGIFYIIWMRLIKGKGVIDTGVSYHATLFLAQKYMIDNDKGVDFPSGILYKEVSDNMFYDIKNLGSLMIKYKDVE